VVDTGWMGGLMVEARKGLGGLISGEREDPWVLYTERERERERERLID